ncbi:MAG: hypothetical protein IID05_05985 [Gemmatimonadetes bacterium]|nr:hypothetical protein [Gemmatimonadota bacterium]
MTRPITEALNAPARPLVRWWRAKAYASRYCRRLQEHRRAIHRRIAATDPIDPGVSAGTLVSRFLHDVPSTLDATLLRFHDDGSLDPDIYLRFAVLHRSDSVFRDRTD